MGIFIYIFLKKKMLLKNSMNVLFSGIVLIIASFQRCFSLFVLLVIYNEFLTKIHLLNHDTELREICCQPDENTRASSLRNTLTTNLSSQHMYLLQAVILMLAKVAENADLNQMSGEMKLLLYYLIKTKCMLKLYL